MELILLFLIASTGLAWLVYWLVWHWLGKARPIMAGSICLLLGFAIALVPGVFFGVSYSESSYGLILIIPTLGPLFLGIISFAIGLFKGGPKAFSNLKKVTELVLEDPDRNDGLK